MTCCKPFYSPRVESDACAKIVRSAMDAWNRAKKRNIHVLQSRGNVALTPEAVTHVAQVQVADAAVQADDNEYKEQLIQQMETIKAEVEAATSALKLTEDGFEDEDDLADFDYDSDYDYEY